MKLNVPRKVLSKTQSLIIDNRFQIDVKDALKGKKARILDLKINEYCLIEQRFLTLTSEYYVQDSISQIKMISYFAQIPSKIEIEGLDQQDLTYKQNQVTLDQHVTLTIQEEALDSTMSLEISEERPLLNIAIGLVLDVITIIN